MKRLILGAGVLGVAGVVYVVDQVNLSTNYTQVEGRVLTANEDCYIKARKSKLVEKSTNKLVYMPCKEAPIAAKAFDYKESDIHRRVILTYEFKSPVDGASHKGKYTDEDAKEGEYKRGGVVMVYAHKEEADTSRIR
jgi:hypothetical protein